MWSVHFPFGFPKWFPFGFPMPWFSDRFCGIFFAKVERTIQIQLRSKLEATSSRRELRMASGCSFYFFNSLPIVSIYGIYANIGGILMVNVTIKSSTMDPMGWCCADVWCNWCNVNPGLMSTPFTAVFHWEGTIEVSDEMTIGWVPPY
jgi:hypothetical protein